MTAQGSVGEQMRETREVESDARDIKAAFGGVDIGARNASFVKTRPLTV
jgi:hypothetical protein